MTPSFANVLVSFVILAVVFGLIEAFRSRSRRQPVFRRGYLTDIGYWLMTPFFTRVVVAASIGLAVVPVALMIYGRVDRDLLLAGYGPLSRLPLWQQAGRAGRKS